MSFIISWVIDYLYLLKGWFLILSHPYPPQKYLSPTDKKLTIVLVPGILNTWSILKPIGDMLVSDGYPVYTVPDLKWNLFSIHTSAKIVKNMIIKKNLNNVVIIAHSKGGLIAKYILLHENDDQRIKDIIAIATPFSGSRLSILPLPFFRELRTNSNIIKNLSEEVTTNTHIFSLYAAFDNHILDQKGSRIENGINIQIPVDGHHKILFSKKTHKAILKALLTIE